MAALGRLYLHYVITVYRSLHLLALLDGIP